MKKAPGGLGGLETSEKRLHFPVALARLREPVEPVISCA
jgi:hypothetical protein